MSEYFNDTQGSRVNCYYIQTDTKNGAERPVLVIGKVNIAGTKGRKSPPDPISGFKCAGTPFGKGHVMSLQLGGPDKNFNIVPQYEQWQQSNDWRSLETDALAFAKSKGDSLFVAKVTYQNDENNLAPQQKAFLESYAIFDWEDYRIPTHFKLWVLPEGQYPGILAGIFGANANRANYITASLDTALPTIPPNTQDYWAATANQLKMPKPDRDFWGTTLLRDVANKVYKENYPNERKQEMDQYIQSQQAAHNPQGGAGPVRNARTRAATTPYPKNHRQLASDWEKTNKVVTIEDYVSKSGNLAKVQAKLTSEYGWTQQNAALITGQNLRVALQDMLRGHKVFQTQGPEQTIALARANAQAAAAAAANAQAAAQAQLPAGQAQQNAQVAQVAQAPPAAAQATATPAVAMAVTP